MKNSVNLMGNLGKDPDVRKTQQDLTVATFSVATKRNANADTEWHRVVCFGDLADRAEKMLQKGTLVDVVGRLQYRKYEKDGEEKQITEIYCNQFLVLKGGRDAPTFVVGDGQAEMLEQTEEFEDDIPF